MKEKHEVFLGFTIIFFVISMIGLLAQSLDLENPNRATIISGLLSMVGGGIGAFGAYIVAVSQMEKSRKFDDEKRLIDLKIVKLDETIRTFNDLKYLINSTDGHIKDMNISIKVYEEKGYTILNKGEINSDFFDGFRNIRKDIEQILNKININKWYIKNHININELYELRSAYSEVMKKYNVIFSGFQNKESIKFTKEFVGILNVSERAYDEKYRLFIDFIEKVISDLEFEIENILSIKT